MHCIQEKDPFAMDKDPLESSDQKTSDSEDEPDSKRPKISLAPNLNLQVYKIPAFNIPKSLSIYPSDPASILPKFVNNPLNLANPLALAAANGFNSANYGNSIAKRYSLPAKLSVTPVPSKTITPQKSMYVPGAGLIRFKKNGEVAKKRGPPKGYKRKPKSDVFVPHSIANGVDIALQNALLKQLIPSSLSITIAPPPPGALTVAPAQPPHKVSAPAHISILPQPRLPPPLQPPRPQYIVPKGVEHVQLELDPADWFPEEPYKMVFSRKKNPKWKEFPFRCEHCFKGYRVLSTLIQHAAERHGTINKELAVPCPCCPHVSIRRKHHKKHLESHHGRRHRIFCQYCLPPPDPNDENYEKEAVKYPFDKFPQFWYASEESLRLHKKRKHPYSAMYNYNWFGSWGPTS